MTELNVLTAIVIAPFCVKIKGNPIVSLLSNCLAPSVASHLSKSWYPLATQNEFRLERSHRMRPFLRRIVPKDLVLPSPVSGSPLFIHSIRSAVVAMDDTTYHHSTATEPMSAMSAQSFFRPRRAPDVPEDVDFLMEHLNDPNLDLKKPLRVPASSDSWEMDQKRFYDPSDADTDSQYDRYSTSRAESRESAAIDFDE